MPDGVVGGMLAKAVPPTQADAVVALNDAFATRGLVLDIAAGAQPAERIEIVHCASAGAPLAIYSRVAITLFAGAKARIVETFLGADPGCQRNAVTRLSLRDGAPSPHVIAIPD